MFYDGCDCVMSVLGIPRAIVSTLGNKVIWYCKTAARQERMDNYPALKSLRLTTGSDTYSASSRSPPSHYGLVTDDCVPICIALV